MQKFILQIITTILLAHLGLVNGFTQQDPLKSGFQDIPDSIQTSIYWYWISDNISKEGVVRDLESMKEVGINRAFIGNIGLDDIPSGEVKMLSEEWWEILHTALKTATDLDIEIGIFNSPGWSQSGGPWIQPEEAMRYLASSSKTVSGPGPVEIQLDKPILKLPAEVSTLVGDEGFQDVRVLAVPLKQNQENTLNPTNTTLFAKPQLNGLDHLIDGDTSTSVDMPEKIKVTIDFETATPFTPRSLVIRTTHKPFMAQGQWQVRDQNGDYQTVSTFQMNRSNPTLHVGFKPYAPIAIALPATEGNHFRLVISGARAGSGLQEIAVSCVPSVDYYSEKSLAKMHQTPLPYWDAYLWNDPPQYDDDTLIIKPSEVMDISKYMSTDGRLKWDVPAGVWTILRMGMTPTGVTNAPASPEATGLEVDKMSKPLVRKHFNAFIGKILKRIPAEERKTFKVVVQDSYETGGQNFTDEFIRDFEQEYGYDPVPYLPVYEGIVIGDATESDRFLWDMRRLVANKVAYDYVAGLREVSHENGLTTWLENYGHWGFPGEFLMYGGQSDEIGGEFWSEGDLGNIENRAATSAGHIYGKRKISAESFTAAGKTFQRYPADFKQRGDRFFAEGINNTLLHVFISQPYEDKNPGMNAWFGNEFNRKNTWFYYMKPFIQYLKRSNFMLQQGINVADVAYFIGEDAPKMTGVTDPPLPVGYQFDYINAEVIERDMTVENGLLTLPHGTQYRVLVLPQLETMRPDMLAKIKELVHDGAVILGPPPSRSPSLENQPEADEQIQDMAAEIWGNVDGMDTKSRKYGKGLVMSGLTMEEALAQIDLIPDCALPEDNSIHFGHRTLPGREIYFVTNQTDEDKSIEPAFRVTGMHPELWNAVTGDTRPLPEFSQNENSTAVPLKLAPYESAFIVFSGNEGKENGRGNRVNFPEPEWSTEITGPWMVVFNPELRGPDEPVQWDQLQDWMTSDDDHIRYYAGPATYTIDFQLDSWSDGEKIMLDLGNLTAVADVAVNGEYAGGVWTPPYHLDITPYVKPGDNKLEITVVNNWVNRLIGDQNLPEEERQTWAPVNPYEADSPLQPSGLFGPVIIKGM